MLGEFLVRLAVALPLVCGLAALSLWGVRRGWLRLPGLRSAALLPPQSAPLEVLAVRSMSPSARLAVIRFDGRDLLLGVTGQSVALLARTDPVAPAHAPTPPQEQAP
jgi:flagellar biogenesis protein FliO